MLPPPLHFRSLLLMSCLLSGEVQLQQLLCVFLNATDWTIQVFLIHHSLSLECFSKCHLYYSLIYSDLFQGIIIIITNYITGLLIIITDIFFLGTNLSNDFFFFTQFTHQCALLFFNHVKSLWTVSQICFWYHCKFPITCTHSSTESTVSKYLRMSKPMNATKQMDKQTFFVTKTFYTLASQSAPCRARNADLVVQFPCPFCSPEHGWNFRSTFIPHILFAFSS